MWDGSLLSPLNVDQFSNQNFGSVWTGSNSFGSKKQINGNSFALGNGGINFTAFAEIGDMFITSSGWIDNGSSGAFVAGCIKGPMYALSSLLTVPNTVVTCDFSGSGGCDVTDLDLMQSLGPIATGVAATGNEQFDLNVDGTIDLVDRDQWLALAATENGLGSPYKLGDANLDGTVDGQDFIAWNAAKFTSNLLWSGGNFNADLSVDGQDFIAWNANKFTSSNMVSVPEPGLPILLYGLLSMLGCRNRR